MNKMKTILGSNPRHQTTSAGVSVVFLKWLTLVTVYFSH